MNCPTCSKELSNDSRTCPHCASEFSLAQWTRLQQYDFLLRESNSWQPFNWQSRRRDIARRNADLRANWDTSAPPLEPSASVLPEPVVVSEVILPPEPPPVAAPEQSFDQWLFSENTIKMALYSGALLLILAGLIFVGANWQRIPWQGKFAVTLAVTAATCALGFGLLLRSKTLRIGGIALIAISAGFAPLNPSVLQRYWLDDLGIDADLTWLIGSLLCLAFYFWLARRTESSLFGYFTAFAVLSSQLALYSLIDLEGNVVAILAMLMPFVLLGVGWALRRWVYLFRPNTILAHIITPPILLVILLALNIAGDNFSGGLKESPWFFVIALWMGAGFYFIAVRMAEKWFELTQFVAVTLLAIAAMMTLIELPFEVLTRALLLVLLAGLFLLASTRVEEDKELSRLLFTFTFVVAGLATIYVAAGGQIDMVWVLLADVILLLAVTLVRRHVIWYTAAIWLMVAPVAVYASIQAESDYQMALMLAGLMVLYVGAAAVIKIGRIGFYSAAAVLSLAILPLAIDHLPIASALAFATAALYFWSAWRERDYLLQRKPAPLAALPALAASGFIFIGHYFVPGQFDSDIDGASVATVLLCTAFVAAALLLPNREDANRLYGQPLNIAGLLLLAVPLVFALDEAAWVLPVVAAIASATLLVDGWLRLRRYQCYIGVTVAWIALAALLDLQNVRQAQAYAIPAGLALLAIGWNEQRHGRTPFYMLFSFVGLALLFGSAFVQSIDESRYAFLLLFESVAAVAWGVRQRSRGYVQIGLLALIANGVVQFGPAFAELPRFVQIGSIGSILLIGGLVALFRRENLLETQDAWRAEWARWNP